MIESLGSEVKIGETRIAINPTFENLFTRDPSIIDDLAKDMAKNGFNHRLPIILADCPDVDDVFLLDGHTRVLAAREAGVEPIISPIPMEFESELKALEYAIHLQTKRRNLSEKELAKCYLELDLKKKAFRDAKSGKFTVAPDGAPGKSSHKEAEILGISQRKTERLRAVMARDTPTELKEALLKGEKTINAAYNQILKAKNQKKGGKSTFNFQQTGSIEWAKWTWNPVTGCKYGCPYCYAREDAKRYNPEDNFEPVFHSERLEAPFNTRIPEKRKEEEGIHNVFVCSMADLFGDWIKSDVIQSVIDVCAATPEWTYIFLTKNPKRLLDFEFPRNSCVGTTVDVKARVATALKVMPQVKAPVKFLSCEPLKEDLEIKDLAGIDWLIIGGQRRTSGEDGFQPEWQWVTNIQDLADRRGIPTYWKPNLEVRPKNFPSMLNRREIEVAA